MAKLRVLVVDDSVVIRKILTDALEATGEIEVVTASSGRTALAKLAQVRPDAVTLDIEMPELDGLQTLKELRKTHAKLPVIMFSTLAERGAAMTLDALAAGANDYVTKPANVGSVTTAIARVREQLEPKLKTLCGRKTLVPAVTVRPTPRMVRPGTIEAVVIGVSTGGPNALSELLPKLPASFPVPVLIVQHMPPMFTKLLADRLNDKCALSVREGAAGEAIAAGQVVIAPGGLHLTVGGSTLSPRLETNSGAEENSCRPAVDVLFRSAAKLWGNRVLSVVLTGMGEDGKRGCETILDTGGQVVAQDEASSVVWGMPGAVVRAGLADAVLPLGEIAAELERRVSRGRGGIAA